jgi:hypothetical protein
LEAYPKELEEIAIILEEWKTLEDVPEKKKILTLKKTPFTLMNGYLYKLGIDNILWICALEHEREEIINEAHSSPVGGHFQADTTTIKILLAGLWWLTLHKDYWDKINKCDKCQWMGWSLGKI